MDCLLCPVMVYYQDEGSWYTDKTETRYTDKNIKCPYTEALHCVIRHQGPCIGTVPIP